MTTILAEEVDPRTLLLDTNVRADLRLTKDFIASIKENGVIVPIVVRRTPEGLHVQHGQRRTVGAIEAGRATVPVIIKTDDADDSRHIVEQLVENTQRDGLTAAETIAAVEQLSLLGCSAANIAKRTRLARTDVDTALTVAASETVREIADKHQALTLEQAAWLTEFENDPEAWGRVLTAITRTPERARHQVERERDDRDTALGLADIQARMAKAHPEAPFLASDQIYTNPKAEYLDNLADVDTDSHSGCPGDAYTLYRVWSDDKEAMESHGKRWEARWLCTDYKANGHKKRFGNSTPDLEPEEAKAARRRTIALNKAGEAATTVRREWLTEFSQRKTAPKDAAGFLMLGLISNHPAATEDSRDGLRLLSQALNLKDAQDWLTKQTQARLTHTLLCARLWAYEYRCGKSIWREGNRFGAYLRALESWGYPLSQPEQVAAGTLTEQEAYDQLTDTTPA